MILINFLYFWPEFDINNNFITKILDNNNISYTISTTYNQDVNIPKFVFIGQFITSDDKLLKVANIPANYIKILYISEPNEHMYKLCYNLFISNNFDYVFGSINNDPSKNYYNLPIFLDAEHETQLTLEKNFCSIFTKNDYTTALGNCIYNRYFKNKVNNTGLCIDIGAGDGITNNYSYFFNNNLSCWKCINIEPLENMYYRLQINRPNCAINSGEGGCGCGNINLKIALSNKNCVLPIKNYYHPESNYNSGLATFTYDTDHENHLIHICTNQFTIEQIETKTYNQLVDLEGVNNNQNVDLLFIDVNNHAVEILEGMRGTMYLPSVIVINTINNQNTEIQESVTKLCNRYKLDYKYDSHLIFTLQQPKYKTIEPALGIGDILTIKMYEVSNNIIFDKFIINICLVKYNRINYINYITFLIKFINKLFNNPKFIFVYKNEDELVIDRYYENINTFYLYDYYNFEINDNNIVNYDCYNCYDGYNYNNKKYIIFHCKARFDLCATNFNNEINILEKFIDEYRSEFDIVLLGERDVEQNHEVKLHKIISIYENLIKLKKNNNVIDLTSDGLYSDNTIESFEKDAKIINNAILNIVFGYGGPLTISMAFSKNSVYYINNLKHPVFDLYMNSYSNMYRDINKFFNYIKIIELCNKYDIQYKHINTTCDATGIGDILEHLLCIRDNVIDKPFYINLNYFTDLYYKSEPINQLEFRIRLIKDVIKYNNIDNNKIIFTFSNNMIIIENKYLPITLTKSNSLKLDKDNDVDINFKNDDNINNNDNINNDDNISNDSYGNGYKSNNTDDNNDDNNDEYVIVHTKCRHLSGENYSLIKENIKLFCNIAKFRYRVIIMGEREFPCTEEMIVHGITTVYNELLGLKNNNIVDDITINNIYSNLDYDNYKNDVNIIKNAKYNICFGLGGQFCTSKTFGKSTIIYCSVINILDYVNKDVFLESSYYCTNMIDFFNVISECCCDQRTINIISNGNIIKNSDISDYNKNIIQYNKDMIINTNRNIERSNKVCIFTFHISTGDNFTMYASVCHFAQKYKNLTIYSLYRNRHTIKQLYNKLSNVKVIVIQEQDYNSHLVPDDYINKSYEYYKHKNYNTKNIDIIKCGANAPNFSGYLFWKVFYTQIGLDYNIRYKKRYNIINRNYKREHELYDKVVKKYGYKYIFVHDHRFLDTIFHNARPNVIAPDINIPIYHPNCNYYDAIDKNNKFANLWYNFISDNLLDYCMVIEKAYAIYISDSSFSCICPYLNLSHIKDKTIYTNLNVIDYHSNFTKWTIIKTSHPF